MDASINIFNKTKNKLLDEQTNNIEHVMEEEKEKAKKEKEKEEK